MYENFYRLSANPFRLTPDPEFCFSYTGFQYAREYLDYALRLGEGFIMVTGRPGTGKTTLAETFLKDLDPTEVVARRIVASSLEADDLLRSVAYAYGIEAEDLDKATLRRRIQQYFARQAQSGWRALLIIDEAQGIQLSALEELRLLADMQAGSRPLLQLFLVGQETLCDLMCVPEMEQFQQRVIATCHLAPLDLRETRAYIEHRLCQADWKGDPELTGAAVLAIHQCSRGVPRHINKLCNRLLLLGYGKGKHTLDNEDVQTISAELRKELLTPLGNSQEIPARINASIPAAGQEDDSLSLSELAIRGEREAAEKPVTPVVRSDTHAATRHAQQAAALRVQAAVKARREKQSAKPSASRSAGVSGPFEVRQRNRFNLLQLFAGRPGWKAEMAVAVAALVVVTLSVTGQARIPVGERMDGELLSDEQPAPVVPSRLAQGVRTVNNGITLPPSGSQGPVSHAPAAIAVAAASPEEPPAESNPVNGDRTTAVVAADAQPRPVEAVVSGEPPALGAAADLSDPAGQQPIASGSDARAGTTGGDERNYQTAASLPSAESGTLPGQATGAVPDEAEIAGPMVGGDELPMAVITMAEITTALQNLTMVNPPGTGGAAAQQDRGSDQVLLPVSREEKIAALLSRGQQSLKDFRLLTPADDNALQYFQEVLALDPGNAAARDGLDRIAAGYAHLVRRARERQETSLARLYVSRGLSVQPGNTELLALQDSLREPPATAQENVMQAAPVVEPELPPQPPPQQESVFAWLKSLFTEAQPGLAEVVDRSVPRATD